MEALRLDRVFKNFGGLEVLCNLSFTIEAGEYVAIIGPNGAGKTTLINVISGELLASSGHISVFGNDITHKSTHERAKCGIGRSFQITHLLSELTLLENVMVALFGLDPSRYQMYRPAMSYDGLLSRAREVLESIDLWDKHHLPIPFISHGEQRKLDVALSLAQQPKLLLLDEPTAGLTAAEIPSFIHSVKSLAKGTTLLLTAHDMDVVFALAQRVIVLYYGQIIAGGTPDEIRVDQKVREIYLGVEEE